MEELRPEHPQRVGDYRLLAWIGQGAMGQVFLGQSPGGRLLAVKVARPELADDPGFRARFKQEVAAARTVSGLFTAVVVDAGAEAQPPWLATAYVPALSLAEAVAEHGPLPTETVLTLAAGLAESLKSIHAAGIVHRDLKPSNVLLAQDGPRVIDFGIARALESTSLTGTGDVVGTAAFMSPEQATGGNIGPPSDVFSLGSVLVFAATGQGPFGTGSPVALLFRVASSAPDTGQVPGQLRPLVDQCLAKDPGDRPSTDELLARLGNAKPAMNWLPAGLVRELGMPGQQDHQPRNAFHPETEAAAPSQKNESSNAWLDELFADQDRWNEYEQLYGDWREISATAPEFAKCLSRLADLAGHPGNDTGTRPTGVASADLAAVRAGRLVPGGELLDAYLASCGVHPEHFIMWHQAHDRVSAATAGVLELRSRTMELARGLDKEHKAYRRRRSSQPWIWALGWAQGQGRNQVEAARASAQGQLRGVAGALAAECHRICRLTDLPLEEAAQPLQEIADSGVDYVLGNYGAAPVHVAVEKLAAIQVDASGVDLSELDLHGPDEVKGTVWTAHTRWPPGIADAIRARSRRIRSDSFQVI
jgi:serine/threonine protein kinase